MTGAWLVPLVVLLPLAGAAVALVFARRPRLQIALTIATLSVSVVLSGVLLVVVDRVGVLVMQVGGWAAPYGISLVIDRLSALMLVVSSIVLLAVLLFSVGQGMADRDEDTPVSIYHPTYLILAAGVFNAFIAGDLFNLYVGFEILLVASYVLMTLGGTQERIRAGVVYIVVSLVSSFLFLAAIAMVYAAVGTVNIAQIAVRMHEIPHDVQLILHVMLLVAFGIKAAVFPLSFWLPDSYPTAPAPVTAVFAGLLTKVGVYAILRTETVMFPDPQLRTPLLVIAGLTLVVGILGAIAQADIKRLLSFTLVSHIGYMIFGIALNTVLGTAATIYYIAHHIVVQTTLFLATGLIERVGGSASITRLSGLLKAAPVVAVLFFIPAMNLGGIPPFSRIHRQGRPVRRRHPPGQSGSDRPRRRRRPHVAAHAVRARPRLEHGLLAAGGAGRRGAGLRPADDARGRPGGEPERGKRALSPLMTGATAGMVVVSLSLTIFAGPLYGVADRAARSLETERGYVNAVLPEADR